ncbi:polyprenol monophosphomannose synthase [Candidatus Pelagibacter sp.]|nr:polyprenol monophosphomannose synthase [Candidatus Pelagibacter sp.]
MSKTLIFSATYNEKDNIKELIYQINRFKENLDILIIDDNSPDQTGEILVKLKSSYNNLITIHRDQKLGLDTAHKFAYQYAIDNGYTKLITMDADLSHDPKEIPVLINLLDKHEFVIGSRYMKGGKCEMQGLRLLMSIIGNKVIRLVLKLKCNEFTTSYRGFNIEKLQNFNLNIVKSKGYSFFMETVYRISQKGFKVQEIPINFKNRTKGQSKIPKIEIFRTLKNLFLLKIFK